MSKRRKRQRRAARKRERAEREAADAKIIEQHYRRELERANVPPTTIQQAESVLRVLFWGARSR